MINSLLQGILSFIINLTNGLLSGLDSVINTYLPSLSTAFSYVNGFIDTICNYSSWVISYTGLSGNVLAVIIALNVFIITCPLVVHTVKLAIKWFNTLRG